MLNNLVLVLNCGSSSLKFSILDPQKKKKYLFGLIQRLYLLNSYVTWYDKKVKQKIIIGNYISHAQSLKFLINHILNNKKKLIQNIQYIGHRVVHGGKELTQSVIINNKIIEYIKKNIIFAPLHNPVNLLGIKAAMKYFPHLSKRNVAVLDTTLYCNIPEYSYLYAIPYYFYEKYNIRRYGAHGISHFYIAQKTSKILNIAFNKLNIISCHLGGGASITVFKHGICIDTSMGLTPLEGLVMGTRSGDLDPAIIFFIHKILNLDINEIEKILIKKSGMLGLTNNLTSDFRYLEKNYFSELASYRAINVFCHRLSKYIGAYITLLQGKLDAIIFTGGIGENSALVREIVLSNLSFLNIKIDYEKNYNTRFGKMDFINFKNTIPILIIPTDEELCIAQETIKLFKSKKIIN